MTEPTAFVIAGPERVTPLLDELQAGVGSLARVTTAATVDEAIAAARDSGIQGAIPHRSSAYTKIGEESHPQSGNVALVVIDSVDTNPDVLLAPLKHAPGFASARVLVIVGDDVTGAVDSLDEGWISAFIGLPMTPGVLAQHSRQQLERWLARFGPDADPDASLRPVEPGSDLLRDFELDEGHRTLDLIAAIESALGPRPRIHLPEGVRLTRQDAPIDGVYVVVDGEVALTRQLGDETMLFHQETTGRVVGVLAMSTHDRSRFTSMTTMPTTVIHLSTDQLDRALQLEPQLSASLASSAISQLSTRLARSEHLHTERRILIRRLEKERTELAAALTQLRDARLELVTQARFATLGELSAGIAHELNNPVAALIRSTEHLLEDVADLMVTNPHGELIANTIDGSATRPTSSTREQRAARRELTNVIGDDDLARRLTAAGVRNPAIAKAATRSADLAATIELSAKLGTSLRAINLAAEHITRLVSSLRSYARPDAEPVDGVNINTSLEDTLILVSHRLGQVEIERDYGDVPGIRARPAQLGQVWTNILVNSADALAGSGSITLRTRQVGSVVAVSIIDDGPGIPEEIAERVFEPRFTTKHGQVRFGMGMGLGIAAHFVHDHGGTIEIDSRPGCTCVRVELPIAGPPDEAPEKKEQP